VTSTVGGNSLRKSDYTAVSDANGNGAKLAPAGHIP